MAYRASEDLQTGDMTLEIPLKRKTLKLLARQFYITGSMRELAELGDATMKEYIEVVEFLQGVAVEE